MSWGTGAGANTGADPGTDTDARTGAETNRIRTESLAISRADHVKSEALAIGQGSDGARASAIHGTRRPTIDVFFVRVFYAVETRGSLAATSPADAARAVVANLASFPVCASVPRTGDATINVGLAIVFDAVVARGRLTRKIGPANAAEAILSRYAAVAYETWSARPAAIEICFGEVQGAILAGCGHAHAVVTKFSGLAMPCAQFDEAARALPT